MKYKLVVSNRFAKSLKAAKKRGVDISIMDPVIEKLLNGIPLEQKYKDHPLKGKWEGFRECHIRPDWLLVYLVENDILTLTLIDTGTHSDLF